MAQQQLLDRTGEPIPKSDIDAVRAKSAVVGLGMSPGWFNPYRAAGVDGQDTADWWPSRGSADSTILPARELSLARIRDVIRNDPIAKAAVERLVDLIVGPGLRLAAKPDGIALGIGEPEALRPLTRSIQCEWRLFSDEPRRFCDIQRRLSMNGLFRLFARTMVVCGETTGLLTWRDAPGRRYSTCVMSIDPDRMSNPDGEPETLTLRGGVEMDFDGRPVAYHVRNAHPGDWWASEQSSSWTRIPRETEWGRPVFMHGFEPPENGQTRAISPFVSLVLRLRMVGRFAESELASAAANALYTAFVESDLPVDDVAQRMAPAAPSYADKLVKFYTENPACLPGGVRIPVMLPGSKVTMNSAPRQTSSFASFQTAFLQSLASSIGLSYEQLSMDWSKTNYSSARAALNEVWRAIRRMAAIFVEQVVTPIYYGFFEEAVSKKYIQLPRVAVAGLGTIEGLTLFHAMPGAFMRARWIGPGRGYVDPVKEAEGAALRMQNKISTLEQECAEQGFDYDELLDQIQVEQADLNDRELPTNLIPAGPAKGVDGAIDDAAAKSVGRALAQQLEDAAA